MDLLLLFVIVFVTWAFLWSLWHFWGSGEAKISDPRSLLRVTFPGERRQVFYRLRDGARPTGNNLFCTSIALTPGVPQTRFVIALYFNGFRWQGEAAVEWIMPDADWTRSIYPPPKFRGQRSLVLNPSAMQFDFFSLPALQDKWDKTVMKRVYAELRCLPPPVVRLLMSWLTWNDVQGWT